MKITRMSQAKPLPQLSQDEKQFITNVKTRLSKTSPETAALLNTPKGMQNFYHLLDSLGNIPTSQAKAMIQKVQGLEQNQQEQLLQQQVPPTGQQTNQNQPAQQSQPAQQQSQPSQQQTINTPQASTPSVQPQTKASNSINVKRAAANKLEEPFSADIYPTAEEEYENFDISDTSANMTDPFESTDQDIGEEYSFTDDNLEDKEVINPYDSGLQAGKLPHYDESDNPYSTDTEEGRQKFKEWMNGFLDGRYETL